MEKGEELLLIKKVKNGDKISYKYFFDTYYHELFRLSFRLVKEKTIAQEIVQEFFVKFWLKRNELNIEYSFRSYSYRSVYNLSLNTIRDSKRYVNINMLTNTLVEEDIKLESSEEETRIKLAVEALPPQCRRVFTLICIDGLSYADAATELGISVNTIKVQMSKAYRMLRANLTVPMIIYWVVKMV